MVRWGLFKGPVTQKLLRIVDSEGALSSEVLGCQSSGVPCWQNSHDTFLCLFSHLSICPSLHPYIFHMSTHPSTHLSFHACMHASISHLFTHVSIHLHTHIPIPLSIHPHTYTPSRTQLPTCPLSFLPFVHLPITHPPSHL